MFFHNQTWQYQAKILVYLNHFLFIHTNFRCEFKTLDFSDDGKSWQPDKLNSSNLDYYISMYYIIPKFAGY